MIRVGLMGLLLFAGISSPLWAADPAGTTKSLNGVTKPGIDPKTGRPYVQPQALGNTKPAATGKQTQPNATQPNNPAPKTVSPKAPPQMADPKSPASPVGAAAAKSTPASAVETPPAISNDAAKSDEKTSQAAGAESTRSWLGRVVFVKDDAVPQIKDVTFDVRGVPFPARVQIVNESWLWLERAWVLQSETMSADDALVYFNRAIETSPSPWSLMRRGSVLAAKGDLDNAIKDFDASIRSEAINPSAFAGRGIAWAEKGHLNKAISDFNDALKIDPNQLEACNNLAWLRATSPDAKVRDGKQAVSLATRACEITKYKEWGLCDTLAAAYAEQGNFAEAVRWGKLAGELATLDDEKKIAREHLQVYQSKKPLRDVKK